MLFNKITPEEAGVKSSSVKRYLELLDRRGIPMHSVLMMKGDSLFCECYYAPFDRDTTHRMYSQTKSFVSIAIGLLIEDGKLTLDDKIADFFPDRIDKELPDTLRCQTIRDMLTMSTVGYGESWFSNADTDRVHLYFTCCRNMNRYPATLWEYDSQGSQILSSLVEKLSGTTLFDYLNRRIFSHLGTFKDATVLKVPTGESWGDSAMICTPRDIMSFARFVMNYGVWNGKRLMNEAYLKEATSKVVDNREGPRTMAFHHGYGYQIWRSERNGFAFVGMGNELTVCLPDDDVIFVCTADCQGDDDTAREYIINHFFELIMDDMSPVAIPEDKEAYACLEELSSTRNLFALTGNSDSPARNKINGATYILENNKMGISEIRFEFSTPECGKLCYINAQGYKELPFCINKNYFGKFPQLGYSNEVGRIRTRDGFMYDSAVSATWLDDQKIMIYVQIIDRYLGTCNMTFAFRDDKISIVMRKCAEDFLNEYCGYAVGRRMK
ncbi:MAG: serine hydrolase [Clostridia bacterium]|nr:serine hydrolase [Clostridia bacterium]